MRMILSTLLVLLSTFVLGQSHPVERVWYNNEKTSKIQIYRANDNLYYGRIIWLRDPKDEKGMPRLDKQNPKEQHRATPLMNMVILKGFKASEDEASTLEGGTIYDPKTGKTYCGSFSVAGNVLKLRGHICGWSWLGRSTTWSLAE